MKKILIKSLIMLLIFVSHASAFYNNMQNYPSNYNMLHTNYDRGIKSSTLANTIKSASVVEDVDKADFIFIVDSTYSMHDDIDSVRSNLAEFSQTIKDKSVDVRFSVIEFRDITYDGLDSTIVHTFDGNIWTSNVASVDAELKIIADNVDGGGDIPETPTDAFAKLFTGEYQFRAYASHFAFLLTDVPAKDSSDDPRIASMAEMIDNFTMYSIHTSVISNVTFQECVDSYSELCSATGGTLIDINTDFASSMLSLANWVADTTVASLKVDVLERGRADDLYIRSYTTGFIFDPNERVKYSDEPKNIGIICDMASNAYFDSEGHEVTENTIADLPIDTYVKKGFTADGNTRLILRAQSDKAGTITFEIPDSLGAKFENLSRHSSNNNSISIHTTKIADNLYQASAVLISPKDYPLAYSFPSAEFNIHLSFLADEDATLTEIDKKLEVHATPVVLIHGFMKGADCDGSFGKKGEEYGVRRQLESNGMKVFGFNYDGRQGPLTIIPANEKNTSMFFNIALVLANMKKEGIACTKVDFVCHSMGGLIARRFIQDDFSNLTSVLSYKQGMCRRLVFIATPNLGSPLANYVINSDSTPFNNIFEYNLFTRFSESELKVIDLLKTFHPIIKALPIISENNDALRDLALKSNLIRLLKTPTVPTFTIYSKIDGYDFVVNLLEESFDVNPVVLAVLRVLPFVLNDAELIRTCLNLLFSKDEYDMAVGRNSAIAVSSKNQRYVGAKHYNHMIIGLQNDIGEHVFELLKGPESDFDTSGITASSVSIVPISSVPENADLVKIAKSLDDAEETINPDEYFVERFVLSSDIQEFSIEDTKAVNIVVSPDLEITTDVFVMVEFGTRSMIRKATIDDTGKFITTLMFTSKDIGTANVSCFSQGNEDNVYISNTVKLTIKPSIASWELNGATLDFLDIPNITYTDSLITDDGMIQYKKVTMPRILYTNVSSDVPVGLYLTTSRGNIYNVSAMSMGTKWTSDDVAMVTDDGRVRGLKEGVTTLTAYYGDLTASISVDVGAEYVYVHSEDEVDESLPSNDDSNSIEENNSLGSSSSSCNMNSMGITLLAIFFIMKSHKRMS